MNKSINNQRKFGIVLQYTQMILSSVISLVYTPVMLKILGQTEYGIYNVANSTIAYLSLLSLGIGASYIRFYSIKNNEKSDEGIKKLNGLYLSVFIIIGLISLALGFFISDHVYLFFNNRYNNTDIALAKNLMRLLSINLSISFPASVFISYIISQEKFIFQKLVNISVTILSPAANICLLYMGYGSIGMVASSTVCSLLVCFVNVYFCIKKLGMKFSFSKPDFGLLKEILVFSIFIAINQLVELINFQTDKLILSKVVNAYAVAVYAVGSTLNNLYVNIASAISNVFTPEINRIVSCNDNDMDSKLNVLFLKVGRIQWFITVLIMSGFIIFGRQFILLWAGLEYTNSYYVALLLMVPMTFMFIQAIGIEVQRAKNQHRVRSIVYLCMAVSNAVMTVWLASMWAEIGAALGTAITTILCLIFINVFYHLKLGLDVILFWKSIISTTDAFFLPILAGIFICVFYTYHSIIDFTFFVVVYTMIYIISVYRFGLNENEKKSVKLAFTKFIKK